MEQYRQGDVLLEKTGNIPKDAKRRKGNNNIIVEGEATGHSHKLVNGLIYDKIAPSMFDRDGTPVMWIQALKGAKLVHVDENDMPSKDHNEIELEIGIYVVIRQREYDEEGNRLVLD